MILLLSIEQPSTYPHVDNTSQSPILFSTTSLHPQQRAHFHNRNPLRHPLLWIVWKRYISTLLDSEFICYDKPYRYPQTLCMIRLYPQLYPQVVDNLSHSLFIC